MFWKDDLTKDLEDYRKISETELDTNNEEFSDDGELPNIFYILMILGVMVFFGVFLFMLHLCMQLPCGILSV